MKDLEKAFNSNLKKFGYVIEINRIDEMTRYYANNLNQLKNNHDKSAALSSFDLGDTVFMGVTIASIVRKPDGIKLGKYYPELF